jgi:hypothetical protein
VRDIDAGRQLVICRRLAGGHRAVNGRVEAPAIAGRIARATGARQDRSGRIEVPEDLTIAGHPEISVIGDMMSLAVCRGWPRSPGTGTGSGRS